MIKWIGQHIVDLIARFRSDVYLEDINTGTIASGGNLGLDSNNKIVKANEPTSHDAVTLAGTPDYITLSGQEITRNQIDLTADVTGTLPVGNTAAKVTSIVAGDGIDVDSATGDVTVTAETASDTNPGVVELATTAETTTGTDATRAVTPDGLKDGYQGSTNVTTLGSITTGVWRGSAIDLTSYVTNTLPVGNGGTGATTLTSNSILTGNGTSAIQAEAGLTYDSEILSVGDDDNGIAQIRRTPRTSDDGGTLYIRGGDAPTSGATDKDGGILRLYGGRGTGAGDGGAVSIATSKAGSSGTGFQSSDIVATFRSDGKTLLTGNLIFEGPVVDGNDTEFSITEQTANRTITVPDATGTMCVSGADGSNMVVLGSGTGFVSGIAAQTWYFGNSLYGFNHFNWKSVAAGMVSDSSTFTLSEDYNGVGQFVPAALSKVVVRVSCRPATVSNETFKVTICSADRDAGGTNTTWTALNSNTNETSIGVWESCDVTYTGSIATSKMLAIGVGIDESSVSTANIRFNWQLVGYLT